LESQGIKIPKECPKKVCLGLKTLGFSKPGLGKVKGNQFRPAKVVCQKAFNAKDQKLSNFPGLKFEWLGNLESLALPTSGFLNLKFCLGNPLGNLGTLIGSPTNGFLKTQ